MLATALVSFMLKGKVDALQTGRKEAIGKISIAEASAKTAKNAADKAEAEAKDATAKLGDATQKAADAEKEKMKRKKVDYILRMPGDTMLKIIF